MVIYRALRTAAEANAPCPSAEDLSELIGSNSLAATVNVMHRLERRGVIEVLRYQRSRQVVITETGARTAIPSNTAPHWRSVAVTLGRLRKERAADADAIHLEAIERNIAVSDFLSQLVWSGWEACRAGGA
jgi:hypothetical protein